MRTITRRQLSREADATKGIAPGESVQVPDDNGGLIITRRKKHQMSVNQMMDQVAKLPGNWPDIDTDALMEDEA
jgi:hypothetical protein